MACCFYEERAIRTDGKDLWSKFERRDKAQLDSNASPAPIRQNIFMPDASANRAFHKLQVQDASILMFCMVAYVFRALSFTSNSFSLHIEVVEQIIH